MIVMPGYRERVVDASEGESWAHAPSGLYVPRELLPAPRPTCIDLFSGVGGFTLGMISGGFDVVAGVDWEPAAALTYLYNMGRPDCVIHVPEDRRREWEKALRRSEKKGEPFRSGGNDAMRSEQTVRHFWLADASKLTGAEMLDALGMEAGEVDCVVGGPPCQGYSKLNSKRSPFDWRNSLVFEFARLVLEINPRTMCMENVPELLSMVTPEGVPVIDALCHVLEEGGFGAYDALRRSLYGTAGIGAALRRKKKTEPEARPEPEPDGALDLFAESTGCA